MVIYSKLLLSIQIKIDQVRKWMRLFMLPSDNNCIWKVLEVLFICVTESWRQTRDRNRKTATNQNSAFLEMRYPDWMVSKNAAFWLLAVSSCRLLGADKSCLISAIISVIVSAIAVGVDQIFFPTSAVVRIEVVCAVVAVAALTTNWRSIAGTWFALVRFAVEVVLGKEVGDYIMLVFQTFFASRQASWALQPMQTPKMFPSRLRSSIMQTGGRPSLTMHSIDFPIR